MLVAQKMLRFKPQHFRFRTDRRTHFDHYQPSPLMSLWLTWDPDTMRALDPLMRRMERCWKMRLATSFSFPPALASLHQPHHCACGGIINSSKNFEGHDLHVPLPLLSKALLQSIYRHLCTHQPVQPADLTLLLCWGRPAKKESMISA